MPFQILMTTLKLFVVRNISSKKGIGLHYSTSLLLPIARSSLGMTSGVTVGLSDVLNEI